MKNYNKLFIVYYIIVYDTLIQHARIVIKLKNIVKIKNKQKILNSVYTIIIFKRK